MFTLSSIILFLHVNRWLYWTDYVAPAKIQRISLDGTLQSILHDTSLTHPYCITLDYDTQTLYWADYTLNKIEKSNADGSNRQRLQVTNLINDIFSLTFFNGRLYWTDLNYDRILTLDVTSTTAQYLTGGLGDMHGIKAITEERQPLGEMLVSRRCGQKQKSSRFRK